MGLVKREDSLESIKGHLKYLICKVDAFIEKEQTRTVDKDDIAKSTKESLFDFRIKSLHENDIALAQRIERAEERIKNLEVCVEETKSGQLSTKAALVEYRAKKALERANEANETAKMALCAIKRIDKMLEKHLKDNNDDC